MKKRLKGLGVLLLCAAVLRLAAFVLFPQNGIVQQVTLTLFMAVCTICIVALLVCIVLWLLRQLKKQ